MSTDYQRNQSVELDLPKQNEWYLLHASHNPSQIWHQTSVSSPHLAQYVSFYETLDLHLFQNIVPNPMHLVPLKYRKIESLHRDHNDVMVVKSLHKQSLGFCTVKENHPQSPVSHDIQVNNGLLGASSILACNLQVHVIKHVENDHSLRSSFTFPMQKLIFIHHTKKGHEWSDS